MVSFANFANGKMDPSASNQHPLFKAEALSSESCSAWFVWQGARNTTLTNPCKINDNPDNNFD